MSQTLNAQRMAMQVVENVKNSGLIDQHRKTASKAQKPLAGQMVKADSRGVVGVGMAAPQRPGGGTTRGTAAKTGKAGAKPGSSGARTAAISLKSAYFIEDVSAPYDINYGTQEVAALRGANAAIDLRQVSLPQQGLGSLGMSITGVGDKLLALAEDMSLQARLQRLVVNFLLSLSEPSEAGNSSAAVLLERLQAQTALRQQWIAQQIAVVGDVQALPAESLRCAAERSLLQSWQRPGEESETLDEEAENLIYAISKGTKGLLRRVQSVSEHSLKK